MFWLTLTLGYCVACWCISYVVARQPSEGVPGDVQLTSYQTLATLLVTPLVVPFVLCATSMCLIKNLQEIQTLRRTNRTVREYEFFSVNIFHVEAWIRQRFETFTGPLIQLGFDLIGDFRMKAAPVVVHDRIFLSAAGDTIATISAVLDAGPVGMISVLADGTCIHTTSVKNHHPERTFEATDLLCLTYLPDASPHEDCTSVTRKRWPRGVTPAKVPRCCTSAATSSARSLSTINGSSIAGAIGARHPRLRTTGAPDVRTLFTPPKPSRALRRVAALTLLTWRRQVHGDPLVVCVKHQRRLISTIVPRRRIFPFHGNPYSPFCPAETRHAISCVA